MEKLAALLVFFVISCNSPRTGTTITEEVVVEDSVQICSEEQAQADLCFEEFTLGNINYEGLSMCLDEVEYACE